MDLGTVGQYGDNLLKPPPKTDSWMHRWIMIHLFDCGTVLVKSAQVTSQLVCIYTAGSGCNSSAPAAATRVDLGTFLTTRSESLMNPVRPMITLGLVCLDQPLTTQLLLPAAGAVRTPKLLVPRCCTIFGAKTAMLKALHAEQRCTCRTSSSRLSAFLPRSCHIGRCLAAFVGR